METVWSKKRKRKIICLLVGPTKRKIIGIVLFFVTILWFWDLKIDYEMHMIIILIL
jgi:hypothetical protein